MSYDGPKEVEEKKSTIAGRALCAIGLHKEYFSRNWRGQSRPHFRCKRKGCNYFNS